MDQLFRIGDLVFRLIAPDEVAPPPNFMLFACETGEAAYTYEIELSDAFPPPQGRMAAGRPDLLVFEENGLETRYLCVKGTKVFYACYREEDDRHAKVLLAKSATGGLKVDPFFTSLLALERRMIDRDAIVLHCAYMRYQGEAILFSAPSETGKTTQATLWERHRGSRVVNGDRSLLQCVDGTWTARGWPVCGSSEVCHDEDTPIRAIVMLSQGKTDTVERLSPFQAFSQVYSQITINRWNKAGHQRAMDLIEQLVTQAPVYHLSCTISEDAVRCLEAALYPQGE